ncbi:MAG: polyphenol oxidase family protein [Synergistaceae bacterium]|nr:polyphenol oxidase family protein [Synergistaceae bacterium]
MKILTSDFLDADFFMRGETLPETSLALIKPSQVHEDNIITITDSNIAEYAAPKSPRADGIFLKTAKACAVLRFADCAPVMLWGEKSAMILHSGYKGTVLNISGKGVAMFDEPAASLHAWVGPCIGFEHYARNFRDDEWTLRGLEIFHAENFRRAESEGKVYFDLAGEIKTQLREKNIAEENIILSGVDTFKNSNCFSYRRGDKLDRMTLRIVIR